ncbi:class I SAM-dependent methyltransferase [bacterium]|nr:class I SAM-dependent methyltransferase [candidate division CSSED10-310 bacterium]
MIDNRKYYDAFAQSYDRSRKRGYHALIDDLEIKSIETLYPGSTVLEVGCGSGLILERLAEPARMSVGVDLSMGMLKRASQRHRNLIQSDLVCLPFAADRFDLTLSFKVLPHIHPIQPVISELVRVTRPGGFLALEFYNPRSLRGIIKRLKMPTRTSTEYRDADIATRYDSLDRIRTYFPDNVEWVAFRGVRVFTPFACIHRIPVIRSVFRYLENKALNSPVSRWAGFVVVILRKIPASDSTLRRS